MKRYRILRLSCYVLTLGLSMLLCLMPACKLFNEANEEKPPETENEEDEYKKGAVIFTESEGYTYLARVTKDTGTDSKEVPVHIFAAHLRKNIGDTIPIDKVWRTREMPPGGWGARLVAVEYFKNAEWIFTWDAKEMEDHYLVPVEGEKEHRVELTDVRFPIPVRR